MMESKIPQKLGALEAGLRQLKGREEKDTKMLSEIK